MRQRLARVVCNVVLLAAACSTVATAQVPPETAPEYVPSAVGDTWVYDYYREDCRGFSEPPPQCTEIDTTLTFRIVGTEEREGETVAVMEGPGGSRALYGYRPAEQDIRYEVLEPGTSEYLYQVPSPDFPSLRSALGNGPFTQTIRIGGEAYTLDLVFVAPPLTHSYARGVGLVEFRREVRGSAGRGSRERWILTGAHVKGRTYGIVPVSTVDEVDGEEARVVVFPNPTASTATVQFSTRVSGTAEVIVVDVLGRTVWASAPHPVAAGVRRVSIPVGTFPPGTYVARVAVDGVPVGAPVLTRAGGR